MSRRSIKRGSLEGRYTHLDVGALVAKARQGGSLAKKDQWLLLRHCAWLQRQIEAVETELTKIDDSLPGVVDTALDALDAARFSDSEHERQAVSP